jgi:hypothetical protein
LICFFQLRDLLILLIHFGLQLLKLCVVAVRVRLRLWFGAIAARRRGAAVAGR